MELHGLNIGAVVDTVATATPTAELQKLGAYTISEFHDQVRKDMDYLMWCILDYRKQPSLDPYLNLYHSIVCPMGRS